MTLPLRASTGARILFVLAIAAFVGVVSAVVESRLGHQVPRVSAAPGVYVQINDGTGNFVFSPVMCEQGNMSPQNSRCATQILISNIGATDSSPAFYTIAAWADTNATDNGPPGPAGDVTSACFNINLLLGTADGLNVGTSAADGPLPGPELGLGDIHSWGLEASVTPDNACQAAQATIIVSVISVGDALDLPEVDEEPPFDNEPESTQQTETTDTTASTDTTTTTATTTALTDEVLGVQTTATATEGETTLVNEILGVQRVPSTGSGGLLGSRSADRTALHMAIACLVAGAALSGFSVLASRRKQR